jgi:hypothetical protein
VGNDEAARGSVDLKKATTELSGGPKTYGGRRKSSREVHRPTEGDEGGVGRSVGLKRATSPLVWKLDESWKRRIASRCEPERSARQQETRPEVKSTPEAGQGAGHVRQSRCKDGVLICTNVMKI